MARVIVLDNLSQDGLDLLESAGKIECEVRTGLQGDELRTALLEFDGAICRSGVKITADALEGNRRLKAIARAGVGTDNIDLQAATRLGIVVMNTPGGNTLSTAEHTIALMLALSRNVHPAYQSLIEGRWDRKKYMGTQLAGKTLGIIGLGRVGQAVAVRQEKACSFAESRTAFFSGRAAFLTAVRKSQVTQAMEAAANSKASSSRSHSAVPDNSSTVPNSTSTPTRTARRRLNFCARSSAADRLFSWAAHWAHSGTSTWRRVRPLRLYSSIFSVAAAAQFVHRAGKRRVSFGPILTISWRLIFTLSKDG